MTVYVIAQVKFTREEMYRSYQSRFAEVFRGFKGQLLAADEAPTILDGEWDRDKVVVMSFPDEGEARRFLFSPEYLEISKDRIAGADVVALMVNGLAAPA